jgi:putative heme-binding domain-containing protein
MSEFASWLEKSPSCSVMGEPSSNCWKWPARIKRRWTLRRDALRSLVEARHEEVAPLLRNLLGHRDLAVDAVRGLAAIPLAESAATLVSRYRQLPADARRESIQALASRPAFARELVAAVQAGTIRRGDVTSFQIRQIRGFGDEQLDRTLDEIWPEFREDTRAKARQIADLRQSLSDDVLADGDRRAGRHVFQRVCATCHVLFGAGGNIGPDLTGGQRSNLTYLLENILDPSAQVAENYRMSILVMVDGRVINGVVSERTRQTLTVQTPTERLVLPLDEIEEVRDSQLSMMPDQLLEPLSPTEIRDLFAYLMGTTQVELPEGVELAEEEQSAADD